MLGSDSDANKATKLIANIGGPVLDPRDIEWTNDLEAGKLLLDWLSHQISTDEVGDYNTDATRHGATQAATDDDDANLEETIYAAMRDTTLEPEEVIIANDERVHELAESQETNLECSLDYMPPSRLKKHAVFVTSETTNVQQETDLYHSRIAQIKQAAKKTSDSIKLLQRAVYDLDAKLRGSEETISELSIKADTTIAITISDSRALLHGLGMAVRKEKLSEAPDTEPSTDHHYVDLEEAHKILSKSKGNIAALIAQFEESMANFDQLSQQDESRAADLQMEAERLQAAFEALESGNMAKAKHSDNGSISALDDAALAELEKICDTLEQEVSLRDKGLVSGSGALDHLLSELHEGYIADKQAGGDHRKIEGVQDQLRRAWSMDQAAILRSQEAVLDETLTSLDFSLAPLERVYTSFAQLAKYVQEAEAVLEACAEELGDIYLDSSQSAEPGGRIRTQDELDDDEMELKIKSVLNECKDLRPAGSTPLVLLNRDDIMTELRSLKARSAHVEGSEKAWADTIINKYSIRPLHPLLPQIYAHAPASTSPPFAFSAEVRALEVRARDRAAALNELAQTVDEEVRRAFEKGNNVKRLDAFIEKWA
ncbi:hypothetical protein BDN70DRAFT_928156 [Pholiota conissans]|uniref:Uncharacterized protein n=1 Tax=Pholiota conissans TaxID=109636 RepID=A0A9P5ZEZ9_9AGAR|nr:hypothetical protein BDN70DRAFT_928156 [Pholiota conissans]